MPRVSLSTWEALGSFGAFVLCAAGACSSPNYTFTGTGGHGASTGGSSGASTGGASTGGASTGGGGGVHGGAGGTGGDSGAGGGGTSSTGGAQTGGNGGATGGTAGTSGGAGGATGGTATGGVGGVPPPLCDLTQLRTLNGTNPVIADFESNDLNWFPNAAIGFVGGGYSYGDGANSVPTPIWKTDVGYASNYSMYLGAPNDSGYGCGEGFYLQQCTDVSVYKGIHFWAKGTAGKKIILGITGVMTTSVNDPKNSGGSCPAGKTCSVNVTETLNAAWTEYTVLWPAFTATNVTLPADLRYIKSINIQLVGPGNTATWSLELWLDNFGFVGP